MQKIQLVPEPQTPGNVTNLFEAVTAMLGRVPNFYRAAAHCPTITMMLLPFNAVIQREGSGSVVPAKLKEMAIIKTSKINGCSYCYAHNTALGEAVGITDEQVLAIDGDEYMESTFLDEREKAAILWAEHVTRNTARSRNDVFESVNQHFSTEEIVELTLIIGMFNMLNRFMESLGIPLEAQDQVDQIKRSIKLDPDKVKNYLDMVSDSWPEMAAGFPRS